MYAVVSYDPMETQNSPAKVRMNGLYKTYEDALNRHKSNDVILELKGDLEFYKNNYLSSIEYYQKADAIKAMIQASTDCQKS